MKTALTSQWRSLDRAWCPACQSKERSPQHYQSLLSTQKLPLKDGNLHFKNKTNNYQKSLSCLTLDGQSTYMKKMSNTKQQDIGWRAIYRWPSILWSVLPDLGGLFQLGISIFVPVVSKHAEDSLGSQVAHLVPKEKESYLRHRIPVHLALHFPILS